MTVWVKNTPVNVCYLSNFEIMQGGLPCAVSVDHVTFLKLWHVFCMMGKCVFNWIWLRQPQLFSVLEELNIFLEKKYVNHWLWIRMNQWVNDFVLGWWHEGNSQVFCSEEWPWREAEGCTVPQGETSTERFKIKLELIWLFTLNWYDIMWQDVIYKQNIGATIL